MNTNLLEQRKMPRKYKADDANVIEGVASSFRSVVDSQVWGKTMIRSDAFKNDLELRGDVRPLLSFHNEFSLPIGLATFWLTPEALMFSAEIDADPMSDLFLEKIDAGRINAVSIGFERSDQRKSKMLDGTEGYMITQARLFELSIVLYGADERALITKVGGRELRSDRAMRQQHLAQLKRRADRALALIK